MRKPNPIDLILNEVALYGGLPLRRRDILTLAKEHLGKDAKEPYGAQYFALHPPASKLDPLPLAKARALMAERSPR